MILISDIYQCDCATKFEWKTYILQSGECIFGKWQDVEKNIVSKTVSNNMCHITIVCPNCNKKHYLTKELDVNN